VGTTGCLLPSIPESPSSSSINDKVASTGLTARSLIAGLLIGILINLSNTYYGLRIGGASQMSMVSALLGYFAFRQLPRRLVKTPLDPSENVLIITVATATGCMPVTAGFIGIIPALEYLIGPDENGPLRYITFSNLVLWSMGLCVFGVIFAALLRKPLVEGEKKLPWPGATATAHLVNTLHRKTPKTERAASEEPEITFEGAEEDVGEQQPLLSSNSVEEETDWKSALDRLLRGALVGGAMVPSPTRSNLPSLITLTKN
jgi:uncharacterized oligopeptide transporter (OPT) family protein